VVRELCAHFRVFRLKTAPCYPSSFERSSMLLFLRISLSAEALNRSGIQRSGSIIAWESSTACECTLTRCLAFIKKLIGKKSFQHQHRVKRGVNLNNDCIYSKYLDTFKVKNLSCDVLGYTSWLLSHIRIKVLYYLYLIRNNIRYCHLLSDVFINCALGRFKKKKTVTLFDICIIELWMEVAQTEINSSSRTILLLY